MASHERLHIDCPSSHKKAKIETFGDAQLSNTKDANVKHKSLIVVNSSIASFEVSSTSEIINTDSGFQDMNNDDVMSVHNTEESQNNCDRYECVNIASNDGHEKVGNECDIDEDDDGDGDDSDAASDMSDLSCMSCLSDMSGDHWRAISGPIAWIHHQMCNGTDPRDILNELIPDITLPPNLDSLTLWRIIVNMLSEPPKRKKLPNVNTIDDVIELIKKSNKIMILTGAGVSVSCGIPDFRSNDGIYARLSNDFPDLPDPQAMFDINYFRKDPRPFYKFAKEIFPGQFTPSVSHRFIRLIEEQNKLLRNYTQNIDTLEQAAGIERVITCHGSFATATCTRCKHKVDAAEIRDDIFEQRIPHCKLCPKDSEEMAVMKPDIVFFGEGLSDMFHNAMSSDKDECDLLIVMGSSLKVRPVALIPSSIPPEVPQILINREPLNHLTFDVELFGDCDVIIQHLCERLKDNWTNICSDLKTLEEITELPKYESLNSDASSEVNNNSAQNDSSGMPFESIKHETPSVVLLSDDKKINDENDDNNERIHPDSTYSDDPEPSVKLIVKRESIALKIPDNKYLHIPMSRYIFKGAEVYESDLRSYINKRDDNDDDNTDSSLSGLSSTSSPTSSSSSSTTSSSSSTSFSSPSYSSSSLSSGAVETDVSSPHSYNKYLNSDELNSDNNNKAKVSPIRDFSSVSGDGPKHT